jgi:type II secretory pathway pseudopilin PulG
VIREPGRVEPTRRGCAAFTADFTVIIEVNIVMQRASRRPHARIGLTLIELIVVLVVLVGLAGIIIPMLPNMLTRTHTATAATNIQEINKWVQTYEQLYFSYPDRWDALVAVGGTRLSYLPDATPVQMVPGKVSATNGEVAALNTAGITQLAAMIEAPSPVGVWSATFNPYSGALTTIGDGTDVMLLSADGKAKLNLPLTGNYVVVGLGKVSTMIGKVTAEPAVHFSDDGGSNPATTYSRYGVIFKISDTNLGANFTRALLVAVVDFGNDGIATTGDHLKEYYDAVNASK